MSQLHDFYKSKLIFEQNARNVCEVILIVFYHDSFTFLGLAWNAPDARKDYAEDHKTIVIYSTLMTVLLCGHSVEEFNYPVIFGDSTRFKALGRLHII